MDSIGRERLRLVIAVALGLVPRHLKKAFADRADPRTEEAARHLSNAATDAVLDVYDLTERPQRHGGAGAQYVRRLSEPDAN